MENKSIKQIIGNKLRKLRVEAGVSQNELGRLVGATGGHISNVEIGKYTLSAVQLYLACIVLQVTPDQLLPTDDQLPLDAQKIKLKLELHSILRESDSLGKQYRAKLEYAKKLKEKLESSPNGE